MDKAGTFIRLAWITAVDITKAEYAYEAEFAALRLSNAIT